MVPARSSNPLFPTAACQTLPAAAILLLGDFSQERVAFEEIASEFSFSLLRAASLSEVRGLSSTPNVAAIFLHAECNAGNWRELVPDARLILCQRFRIRSDENSRSAFHALRLPLHPSELRQALGFVWAAVHRKPVDRAHNEVSVAAQLRIVSNVLGEGVAPKEAAKPRRQLKASEVISKGQR